jgi:hypothetical protein
MPYQNPREVISPKNRWRLHEVIYDGGEDSWAVAEGQWENKGVWGNVLAIRWNGDVGHPKGNPQSRGLPTWFIVPGELADAIRAIARAMKPRK